MSDVKVSDYLLANYRDYYEEGDSEWRRLGAIGKADNIVALCSDLPRTSVLEIGAGEGAILKRLSEIGFGEELFALEISPTGVETTRRKRIHRLAECKVFDGYHVPYDNDRFDLAILSHVVEHVEHPRHLICEAARVARHVFIEVPLEDNIRLPDDFVFDKVGHINFYSPKTIRRLAQSCGLRVIRQITTNPPRVAYTFQRGQFGAVSWWVKQAFVKALPQLAPKIFTYHGALVCEKER